jgi:hypothetical protein
MHKNKNDEIFLLVQKLSRLLIFIDEGEQSLSYKKRENKEEKKLYRGSFSRPRIHQGVSTTVGKRAE